MKAILWFTAVTVVAFISIAVWFFFQGDPEPSSGVTAPPVETAAPGGPLFTLTGDTVARFELEEVLRGRSGRVTGISNLVFGQFVFDAADLATVELGTVLIDARAFTTGVSNRDRAIRGPILDSSVYEFIEFTAVSINGLPHSMRVGETARFRIAGDLKIRDVIRPVVFAVSATLVGSGRIEGTATAIVSRSDFELRIPKVAHVADVGDEVLLGIDFVAESA